MIQKSAEVMSITALIYIIIYLFKSEKRIFIILSMIYSFLFCFLARNFSPRFCCGFGCAHGFGWLSEWRVAAVGLSCFGIACSRSAHSGETSCMSIRQLHQHWELPGSFGSCCCLSSLLCSFPCLSSCFAVSFSIF